MTKLKTIKNIKKFMKDSKRPCGLCGEEDTILLCCECARVNFYEKGKKEGYNKALEDVKRTLKEGVIRCGVLPLDWAFDRIEELNKKQGEKSK